MKDFKFYRIFIRNGLSSSAMIMFISSFIAISFFSSCHEEKKEVQAPIEVTTATAEPKTVPITIEYVGQTESSHMVEIRARVEGYLDKIAYKEGSLVKQGQLLFQIDPRPFQAKLEEVKGQLAAAKANLTRAHREYDRIEPLYKQNAVSRRDRDNAEAALLTAEASVESAKGSLMDAEVNLGYTTITSPVTGLSDRAYKMEGALVSPGPASLLTTVSVTDPMWVNFSVSENDLLKYRNEIAKGLLKFPPKDDFEVQLVLADGSIFSEKGHMTFTAPLFSKETGTFLVRSEISNPQAFLRPGQFVRVRIIGATRPNAIVVPQQSVIQTSKGHALYVVKDGKAELRNVEVGDWQGVGGWFITSGLKSDEKVVVNGTEKVRDGALVKVVGLSTSKAENANTASQPPKE